MASSESGMISTDMDADAEKSITSEEDKAEKPKELRKDRWVAINVQVNPAIRSDP
jgi:hypothetical protein